MTVQDHRRVPATLFWVRIAALKPFLELVSKFIEISTKFTDQYPNRKLFRNLKTHQRTNKNYSLSFIILQKYIHPAWRNPFIKPWLRAKMENPSPPRRFWHARIRNDLYIPEKALASSPVLSWKINVWMEIWISIVKYVLTGRQARPVPTAFQNNQWERNCLPPPPPYPDSFKMSSASSRALSSISNVHPYTDREEQLSIHHCSVISKVLDIGSQVE